MGVGNRSTGNLSLRGKAIYLCNFFADSLKLVLLLPEAFSNMLRRMTILHKVTICTKSNFDFIHMEQKSVLFIYLNFLSVCLKMCVLCCPGCLQPQYVTILLCLSLSSVRDRTQTLVNAKQERYLQPILLLLFLIGCDLKNNPQAVNKEG
jgi:hypothetical protein